jgi:hypothetical protein
MARWPGEGGNGGGGRCASERLARAKREVKEGARRGGTIQGCSRWLLYCGGGSSCAERRRGTGGGIDRSVHRLLKEEEAEVANKGGVRAEGVAGWLLTMAWETGGGLVRRGQGAEDGDARPACPREEDEGGAGGWAGQRPRPSGGLAAVAQKEGKGSGAAGVEGEVGRDWAESGVGLEFKRNSFRISIYF